MALVNQITLKILLVLLFFLEVVSGSLVTAPLDSSPKRSPNGGELKRLVPRVLSSNATANDVDSARATVASAIAQMRTSNKARVQNPLRNNYVLKPGTANQARRQSIPSVMVVTPEIASAAALVTEVDASAKAANGTLNYDYSEFNALRHRNGGSNTKRATTSFWMEDPTFNNTGSQPFGGVAGYTVFRNVRDYGATGTGFTDDTAAINAAISAGNRCDWGCESSSVKGAVVYFPAGTYLVSGSIIAYYNTQLVGNANNPPTIIASPNFVGLGVITTDVYIPNGGTGPDGLSAEWYINTSNFYRQIRNFNIDIRQTDQGAYVAAIHYQVSQATSLYNVVFISTQSSTTTQQGIYAENGSGGFSGGAFGIWGGNQQFTADGCVFQAVGTAIQTIWDWGWTWRNLEIDSCTIGINLLNQADQDRGAASLLLQDTIFKNTPTAILIGAPSLSNWKDTTGILLDNVALQNVVAVVKDLSNKVWLAGIVGQIMTIDGWTLGNYYVDAVSTAGSQTLGTILSIPRNPLLTGSGNPILLGYNYMPKAPYLSRPKPQYGSSSASQFVRMKSFAVGDGVHDDTVSFQNTINAYAGKSIIFIDAGSYILTDTIVIPPGAQIVGECWAQLVASGAKFQDMQNPHVLFQVGSPGQTGIVEIQDLLFTTTGPTAGLIAVEWNLNAATPGAAAMWDCHVRIGGALGSNLQVAQCPSGSVNTKCNAASLMIHLKPSASAYLENVWAWTADHDLDSATSAQVSVFTARGMLIESTNPVWLFGTAVEHATLYQYAFNEASNIVAGMIQTESPYYQPAPSPPAPFAAAVGAISGDDPALFSCTSTVEGCDASWALRIVESSNITISGAGLYTWFDNYVQTPCVDNQNCQSTQVQVLNSNGQVYIYNLVTIGATNMVSETSTNGLFHISAAPNTNMASHPFWSLVTMYQPYSIPNDGGAQSGEGDVYVPPSIWSSANPGGNCIPPCTLIFPPYPLSSPSTITWPLLTTTLLSWSASKLYTITTTISVPPEVISVIEFWAVTVYVVDPKTATFTLEQSIMPPSIILSLPPNEATFPPSQYPQYLGSTPVTPTSSTSSTAVILPLFFSTSTTVTIQPQPTYSITTPPNLVPVVTYKSAKPTSTCTTKCGRHNCRWFGCGFGCGIFGCDGGCGGFGCGGGCGLFGCGGAGCLPFGCGGGCGPLGCPGACPLEICGGIGCVGGACGDSGCPNGDCNSQSECSIKTATDCVQYCTVVASTTSCTSSTCYPVVACDATGTTTSVTSTTTESCPVVTTGQAYVIGNDIFGGCNACAWPPVPIPTTGPDIGDGFNDPDSDTDGDVLEWPYNKREAGLAYGVMEKRADVPMVPVTIKRAGFCPINTLVTQPIWINGGAWLRSATNNQVVGTQTQMVRWLTNTDLPGCTPTVSLINDASMAARYALNRLDPPSIDHVWEKGWMKTFWNYVFGGGGSTFTCAQFNTFFFTGGCATPENRLQVIWNALPSVEYWDFIGMVSIVNNIKGLLADNTRVINQVNNVINGNTFVGAGPSYAVRRGRFYNKMYQLRDIAVACDIWRANVVFTILDRTNDRIYNKLRAIDRYVADNQATMLVTTNFAAIYKSWLTTLVNKMFTQAKGQSDRLVQILDHDLQQLSQPPLTNPGDIATLMALTTAYQTLKNYYLLSLGNANHRCLATITLSWTQWTVTGSNPGCCGCNCVTITPPGMKRQAAMCGLDESTPTDASGGTGSQPTSVVSNSPTTTTTLKVNQSSYPTATAVPPPTVFCYSQLQDTAAGTIDPYIAFNATEGDAAINGLCTAGHTIRPGNTNGYNVAFATPLSNGHTKQTYAVVSWATNQAGCAKQASLAIKGTGCVNALAAAVNLCDAGNVLLFGGAYVESYSANGCLLWEVFANIV